MMPRGTGTGDGSRLGLGATGNSSASWSTGKGSGMDGMTLGLGNWDRRPGPSPPKVTPPNTEGKHSS